MMLSGHFRLTCIKKNILLLNVPFSYVGIGESDFTSENLSAASDLNAADNIADSVMVYFSIHSVHSFIAVASLFCLLSVGPF